MGGICLAIFYAISPGVHLARARRRRRRRRSSLISSSPPSCIHLRIIFRVPPLMPLDRFLLLSSTHTYSAYLRLFIYRSRIIEIFSFLPFFPPRLFVPSIFLSFASPSASFIHPALRLTATSDWQRALVKQPSVSRQYIATKRLFENRGKRLFLRASPNALLRAACSFESLAIDKYESEGCAPPG